VTLAHRGVLFLDEIGDFRRDVIESLGAALDSREVAVDRAGVTRRFPCNFLMVAASNPCPCGRGEDDCVCEPLDVNQFRVRMTRGLGDHLPLRVEVPPPTTAEIAGPLGESSAVVRRRVMAARERAEARLGAGRTNAEMTPLEVAEVPQTTAAVRLLAADLARHPLPRTRLGETVRLARTVSDLAGSESVGVEEMRVAIGLLGDDVTGAPG
jgi:magnesium chelatase family protein